MIIGFLAGAGAFSVGAVENISTEWDQRDAFLWKVGVVDQAAMTPSGIEQIYMRLLREASARPHVVIISAFRSKTDARRYMSAPPPEASYEERLKALRHVRDQGPLPATQLFAIGSNVVVQATDGTHVTRTVIRGSDPTSFRVGPRTCRLLDVYITRLPRSIRPDGLNPPILTAHVLIDASPSTLEAEGITKWVQRTTGDPVTRVQIRTDPWFLQGFPLWYPFSSDLEPPSPETYTASGETFCSGDASAVRCRPVWIPER